MHLWNPSAALLLLAAFSGGCDETSTSTAADLAAAPDLGPSMQSVSIRFAAEVGSQAFACGKSYTGVGRTAAAYTLGDFRVFVHDVRLVDDSGKEVPVTLEQDGVFQHQGLALLDFEDGTSDCTSGTSALHTAVTGSVPTGSYKGLRFRVGVPVELNHGDPTTAPSPLNISSMEWVWQSGYKFVRVDGKSGQNAFVIHLGSTGCAGPGQKQPPMPACVNANRFEVSFDSFDASKQVVVADVARVLAGSDVTTNTANTPPGCMSGLTDPECEAILPRLGLPYNQVPAGPQLLFSAR